jgi:hypothetical protein
MTSLYFLIVVFLIAIVANFYFTIEAFKGTLTTDSSGNVVALTDISGNTVSMPPPGPAIDTDGTLIGGRLKDLISVLSQSNLHVEPAASLPAASGPHDQSLGAYYKTSQQQPRFERATVLPRVPQNTQELTPSIAQGGGWPKPSCKKPGQQPPDMNEYIRKDAIPCWGCTLDY